ncbi:MAG: NAD-dependent epimerase/dehydratase family protein [Methylococcaceae bacterium]|nr:NAD-dependent epimerase/dehydratase family protein [Methylococcaceae bacterium]
MKTLVTGANGFLGSAIVRHLFEAGHEVRVLDRAQSDRRNLNNLPVEICEGDLRDISSIKRAVSGCDNLFHVAANYRLWIPDPDVMYAINVTGTQSLILAAAEAGLKRIVYTSSVATPGFNPDGNPADETTLSSLPLMTGHYKRSKFLAEQAVQRLTDQHKLSLVIVNPSTPIGPCDIKPTPTGRIVLDTLLDRMPAYVDTGLDIIHVDDVARGHLLAFEQNKAGERYVLGGENMSLLQILEMIDEITGKKSKRIRLPHNLVLPAAWLMEKAATLTKVEPRATTDSVRMAKKQMFFFQCKSHTGTELPASSGPGCH